MLTKLHKIKKKLLKLLFMLCLSSTASASLTGSGTQSFSPVLNSKNEFTSVLSTESLSKRKLSLSTYFDYSENTLPLYLGTGGVVSADESLTFNHFLLAYGLSDKLDIGLTVTNVLSQSLSGPQNQGYFSEEGLTRLRATLKHQILNRKRIGYGLSVIGSVDQNYIENTPFQGVSPGASYILELALDRQIGRFLTAANIGYIKSNPGVPVTENGVALTPIESTALVSLGANYKLSPKWLLNVELHSSFSDLDAGVVDRSGDSYEVLLGGLYKARWSRFGVWNLNFGVAKGLNNGVATPSLRAFMGLNFDFGLKKRRRFAASEETEEQQSKQEEAPKIEQVVTIKKDDKPKETLQAFDLENTQKSLIQKIILNYVEFDFNSSELNDRSKTILSEIADHIKQNKVEKFVIIGHTDFYGKTAYNEVLSLKRSFRVYEYFASAGIDKNIMSYTGYGKRRPLNTGVSEESRRRNRRVEIVMRNKKEVAQ